MNHKQSLAELPEHGHFLIEALISTVRLFLEDISPYWIYREKKDGVYCLVLYSYQMQDTTPYVSITHHPNFDTDVLITYLTPAYRKGTETICKEEIKRYTLPAQQLIAAEEIAKRLKEPSVFLTVV
jgi:hypothetical protein